jgi:hypothetical protein
MVYMRPIEVTLQKNALSELCQRISSMAFILLTIIILGNTDKLDRQALGPLLGTTAGYIFGKGIASATTDANRNRQTPPPPPPPTAPP